MIGRCPKLAWALLAGTLALALGSGVTGSWGTRGEVGVVEASATPLFERRLDEMSLQFGTAPAAAPHMLPAEPERRQMAPAQQNALLWVSQGVSGCAASGCPGSGCVASGCLASACVGSGCGGSNCAGSACMAPGCSRIESGEQKAAYCPLDDDHAVGEVRLTGFEIAPTSTGTEVRFAAAGGGIRAYRVFRDGRGHDGVLVSEGPATADRLIHVVDRGSVATGYTVELIDAYGRVTQATLPEPSPPLVAQGPARSERLTRVADTVPPATGYAVEVVDSFGRVTRVALPAGSSQFAKIAARPAVGTAGGG